MTTPSSPGAQRPARSYALILPSDWVALDLAQIARSPAAVADLQSRLTHSHPRASPVPAQLTDQFQTLANAARRSGVIEAYLYSRAIGDRMAVASLTIAAALPEHPGEHTDLDLLALRLRTEVDAEQPPTDISIAATLAGETVRIERRRVVDDATGPLETHEVQYLAPIPAGERLLILTFTTPNVGAARPFTELFDAIAGGLQWRD
jgi:hypothetical protein